MAPAGRTSRARRRTRRQDAVPARRPRHSSAHGGTVLIRRRTTAEPAARTELIAALRLLHELLVAHLDEEEQRILPLVTAWITADEWARLAQHGFAHMPKRALFRQLGAILEDADDIERHDFLATVPPPVRLLWTVFGPRAYLRHVKQVRGELATGARR